MSPDERGLVSSYLGDMHFNSRPTSAQTVTHAIGIEDKLVSALVTVFLCKRFRLRLFTQARFIVSYFKPSCHQLERRVTWTSLGQLIQILKISIYFNACKCFCLHICLCKYHECSWC